MTRSVRPSCLALITLLTGCEVGPDFHAPGGVAPDRYTEQGTPARTQGSDTIGGAAQNLAVGRDVAGDWWALFRSPALTALVAQAVMSNPGLEAARQALRNAEELTLAQWSGLLPAGSGTFSRARAGNYPGANAGSAFGLGAFSIYDAQLTLTYNFDVWGGTRRGIESRVAQADDERALLEATYLTLTGNIVQTAINEASLAAQIAVQHRVIDDQSAYLKTIRTQFELGGATGTDVAQQQAQVAQAEALLPALETALAQARDAMAAYVGRVPAANGLPAFDLASLTLPTTIPVSLPASLVLQRPDVRQAEANLHEATALVGVAVANRLPQISLNAQWGTEALRAGELFTPGTGLSQLITQAVQPIFAGGLLLHQQRAAVATMRELAALWQQTTIGAFQNVADVLVQLDNDSRVLQAQLAAERSARRALDLAQLQYRLGGVSYLTVLTAEVTDQQAAILLVRAQAARFADTAALFIALGGGWRDRADVPPPPSDVLRSLLPWSHS